MKRNRLEAGIEKVGQSEIVGPVPLPVIGEMEIILKLRYGTCSGCEWHPDVCKYCAKQDTEENLFGEGNA